MIKIMDTPDFSSQMDYIQTPDGISIRYGYWPCSGKSNGTVVLLNGRSEFLEKYKEPVFLLNRKGFNVFSFDWRGQGLSSRLLSHRHKGHVHCFEDYLIDLKTCLTQIVFPKTIAPIFFLAHSMGGHVAMRYILEQSWMGKDRTTPEGRAISEVAGADKIRGAVLSSPMIGIRTTPFPVWFAQILSKAMAGSGFGSAYALGSCDYDPDKQIFKGNLLTSDPVRYEDHINAIKQNPLLAIGGITYGWLSAAFESMAHLDHLISTSMISKPILIAGAGADKIVSLSAQRDLCSRISDCTFKLIPESRHEILKETDRIQVLFWSAFDDFIMDLI